MSKYIVSDPQGVYEDQVIEADLGGKEITEPAMRHLSIGAAKAIAVKVIAIEQMYGCPITDVDPRHVRDMLRSVTMRLADATGE